MSSPLSSWWCYWWRLSRQRLSGKTVDGANGVATLTGGSGGRVAGELTAIMGGVATAGVGIAGTTAGAETARGQVMAVPGAIAMLAGGIVARETIAGGPIDSTIVAGGTGGITIDVGTLASIIVGETSGHATCACEGTKSVSTRRTERGMRVCEKSTGISA